MSYVETELKSDYVKWILPYSVRNWIDELPVHVAAAISSGIVEFEESTLDKTEIIIPSELIVTWSNSVALELELPPLSPFGFDLRLNGTFGKPGALLSVRWLRPGKRLLARDVEQDGIWLRWQNQTYRVAAPQFEVIKLIEQFNLLGADATIDEHFFIWAKIRTTLGNTLIDEITDHYLKKLQVVSPSAFSLSINEDEQGEIQIDPILLEEYSTDDGLNQQYSNSLTQTDALIFTQRLDQLSKGASAFPLEQGAFGAIVICGV